MQEIYFEGLLLQASLIFALGPQNIFVIESGLKRHYHLTVSLVCFLCDLALIMLGVAGAATFFNHYPEIKIVVGFLGAGFLILYGVGKIRHKNTEHLEFEQDGKRNCLRAAVLSSVVFSVVNPHAYLDGIVLIGGYSTKYSDLRSRLILGMGAASFSLFWFLLLSIGASFMIPFFRGEKRMRIIMGTSGVILIFLSMKLGLDVIGWMEELYPDTISSMRPKW